MKRDITKIVKLIEESNKEIAALMGDNYELPDEVRTALRESLLNSKLSVDDPVDKHRLFDAMYRKSNAEAPDNIEQDTLELLKSAEKFLDAADSLAKLFRVLFQTLKPINQCHG